MDPRVKTSTAGLERKFQLETRLASLLTQTSEAVQQAGSIRDPLQKVSGEATGPMRDSIQAFQNKFLTLLGAPAGFLAPPANENTLTRANSQVAVLYGQIWQVDADPTTSQSEALAAIERDAADVMKRWDAFRTTDLPALNHSLGGANLPEIKIDTNAHKDEGGMDEKNDPLISPTALQLVSTTNQSATKARSTVEERRFSAA